MFRRLINPLIEFISRPHKQNWLASLAVLIVVLSPIVTASYLGYRDAEKQLTELVLHQKSALARFASIALREKFDRVVEVGVSLATRVQFRKHIEAGRWDEAIKIVESVPADFPYVDTVALFDPEGVLKTVTPLTPPIREAIGKSFAYRDYYIGVSKSWEPYISEIFKRAVEPAYNVVSVAIPIKAGETFGGQNQKILGVLLLTIKLDVFLEWAREVEVGGGGFTYFVDRNGNVAGHPQISSLDEVVNFSNAPAVKKALAGEKGSEVIYNPFEDTDKLSAYERVPGYGWGVVVEQPPLTAFAMRDAGLQNRLIISGITLLIAGLLVYFIISFLHALADYRQKEKIFLESVGDGLMAVDRHWNVTLWNKAASDLTGWRHEEVLGKPLRDFVKFVREYDRKENIAFIEEAMLFGKPHKMENNTLLIRRDGSEINVGDSASPIFDRRGEVNGAIIVFRDVSQEREADKMKEEFVFRVVHDLRAPATAIKLAAESHSDTELLAKDPQALKESTELIQEANSRMLKLIDELLESARKSSGAAKEEKTDITPVIKSVLKEAGPFAFKNKVKINYAPPADLPKVSVSEDRLKEIFSNLVDNAIKYNQAGGSVTVTHRVEDGSLETEIKDTGAGIPKESRDRIFTPYFRSLTSAGIKGTGLGLYIVKKTVEDAGGKIRFESPVRQSEGGGEEANKGTTFYISLPAR